MGGTRAGSRRKNERSNTKRPDKREPLFVRYLLKGRWTTGERKSGMGWENRVLQQHAEPTAASLVFPSREFRIVFAGEFLSTPLKIVNQTQGPSRAPSPSPSPPPPPHCQRRLPAHLRTRVCATPSTTCPIGACIMPH